MYIRVLSMKAFLISSVLVNLFFGVSGESLDKYWIVEQDFLKMGKKEIFEQEKKLSLTSQKLRGTIVMEDLENPQYIFFMPLDKISSLEQMPPLQEKEPPLLSSCIHYSIFSLHQWLDKLSFHSDLLFSKARPYCSYVLYDITPGSQKSFEEHLQKVVVKQKASSLHSWGAWKVLIGADTPKYLLCASFSTKEELKDAHLEDLWEEPALKEILRNKKGGWMKRSDFFAEIEK